MGNNQPHIVVFTHEEYYQYFIAIEQKLCMECADVSMAIFLLLASHYIFNLSYHSKIFEMMRFFQEKVAKILSNDKSKKMKSPLAASHVSGISGIYDTLYDFEMEQAIDDEIDMESGDDNVEDA